jgi:hypothetical protein
LSSITLAQLRAHYQRPEYDPFAAYADFQAHPENYVLVSDIMAEVTAAIAAKKAPKPEDAALAAGRAAATLATYKARIARSAALNAIAQANTVEDIKAAIREPGKAAKAAGDGQWLAELTAAAGKRKAELQK